MQQLRKEVQEQLREKQSAIEQEQVEGYGRKQFLKAFGEVEI